MQGGKGGEIGVDNGMAEESFRNVGAWILGRNMFGSWPDESWKGWWGEEPPYHVPTFVLTHHARKPVEMEGGTIFHFVTDGIESALRQARAAAGDKDIRLGGGVPSRASAPRTSSCASGDGDEDERNRRPSSSPSTSRPLAVLDSAIGAR